MRDQADGEWADGGGVEGGVMAQGQGRHTANKIAAIEAFLTQNISVVRRAIGSSHYFHFDLNAGCGINELAGCIGSPLAFRAAALKAGMPEAWCFAARLILVPRASFRLAHKKIATRS